MVLHYWQALCFMVAHHAYTHHDEEWAPDFLDHLLTRVDRKVLDLVRLRVGEGADEEMTNAYRVGRQTGTHVHTAVFREAAEMGGIN